MVTFTLTMSSMRPLALTLSRTDPSAVNASPKEVDPENESDSADSAWEPHPHADTHARICTQGIHMRTYFPVVNSYTNLDVHTHKLTSAHANTGALMCMFSCP